MQGGDFSSSWAWRSPSPAEEIQTWSIKAAECWGDDTGERARAATGSSAGFSDKICPVGAAHHFGTFSTAWSLNHKSLEVINATKAGPGGGSAPSAISSDRKAITIHLDSNVAI